MAKLMLEAGNKQNVTIISNYFIDRYMCNANGEFVKIYLYLLRCANDIPENFSISLIADKINLTEKDVLRALKYWEKTRLLTLDTDPKNHIQSIALSEPPLPSSETMTEVDSIPADTIKPVMIEKEFEQYIPDQLNLSKNPDIQQILFITEQYLGRTMNPEEIMRIYYFYDVLHFSTELIEYLIEYCISCGHKNMRYIETVAVSWAKKDIQSVSAAKEESGNYNKDYFSILKAFGIRGRNPVKAEITYMNKWLNTYHFTTDIIAEACSRTVGQVGNPSFPYADTILSTWHRKGIVMKKDIKALDEAHFEKQSTSKQAEAQKESFRKNPAKTTNNKFNNFDQRSYDYAELEKQLIQM